MPILLLFMFALNLKLMLKLLTWNLEFETRNFKQKCYV
jgi:hypothetical protein